jgi:phage host-nuclease inhibitor protein Gam
MSLSRKLIKIKDEIAEATESKTREEGALSQNLKRLEKEFDCKTIKDAQKLLSDLEKKAQKAEKELNEKISELEESYADI